MSNFDKATNHFLSAHSLNHETAIHNLHRCVHKYEVVPSWHFAMLNDVQRNEVHQQKSVFNNIKRFDNAIKNALEKKKSGTVLDIGAGVLALIYH